MMNTQVDPITVFSFMVDNPAQNVSRDWNLAISIYLMLTCLCPIQSNIDSVPYVWFYPFLSCVFVLYVLAFFL